MRGPYERLKYDLRRLWECPACQRRERLPGDRTGALCPCQEEKPAEERVWMRLLEDCEIPMRPLSPVRPAPLPRAAEEYLIALGELPPAEPAAEPPDSPEA